MLDQVHCEALADAVIYLVHDTDGPVRDRARAVRAAMREQLADEAFDEFLAWFDEEIQEAKQ